MKLAQALLEQSIKGDLLCVKNALKSDGDFSLTVGNTQVVSRTERYPNEKGFDMQFTLVREKTSL